MDPSSSAIGEGAPRRRGRSHPSTIPRLEEGLRVKIPGEEKIRLAPGDVLILVDVQNDFLPGGGLSVPRANRIIPVLNRYVAEFSQRQLPIFATRDWHPTNHCSFQAHGGCWPVHCVADSKGARFPSELILPPWTVVISKGVAAKREARSGFAGTNLEKMLRGSGLRRLFVGGLATDYCLLNTVKDALAGGFSVYLLGDAIRARNIKPRTQTEMCRLGAVSIRLHDLAIGARQDRYEI